MATTPSRDEYHSDFEHITSSMLRVHDKSPFLYFKRYIEQSLPRDTTPSLNLGLAAHALILEGEDAFDQQIAVAPLVDRRTTKGREVFNEFQREAEASGKTVIDSKQAATVRAMAESVRSVPLIRLLLQAEGVVEFPVFWVDGPTGLKAKCRPDKWLVDRETVLDLKTSSDGAPYAFQKSLMAYGYATQAEHYKSGTGAKRFIWIVVDSTEPFETRVFELDPESVAVAHKRYRQSMDALARSYEKQDWGRPPDRIEKLSLPAWAMAATKEERARE